LGVAHKSTWGEDVTVIVHHVPESEESEEGYEAVTMKGVPFGLVITASDSESAEGALNKIVSGLKAFGFVGRGHQFGDDLSEVAGDVRRQTTSLWTPAAWRAVSDGA
jgi:hypothetical protein